MAVRDVVTVEQAVDSLGFIGAKWDDALRGMRAVCASCHEVIETESFGTHAKIADIVHDFREHAVEHKVREGTISRGLLLHEFSRVMRASGSPLAEDYIRALEKMLPTGRWLELGALEERTQLWAIKPCGACQHARGLHGFSSHRDQGLPPCSACPCHAFVR